MLSIRDIERPLSARAHTRTDLKELLIKNPLRNPEPGASFAKTSPYYALRHSATGNYFCFRLAGVVRRLYSVARSRTWIGAAAVPREIILGRAPSLYKQIRAAYLFPRIGERL